MLLALFGARNGCRKSRPKLEMQINISPPTWIIMDPHVIWYHIVALSGNLVYLVGPLRVPCHLQESLLKKVEDKLPHKHQKLQPINHGFALNHFVARHTGSDDVSSYDLAFTMPPTVSNQSKENIC